MNKKKKTSKQSASSKTTNSTGSPMDVSLLERIVRLMSSNDLNTVEVRDIVNLDAAPQRYMHIKATH